MGSAAVVEQQVHAAVLQHRFQGHQFIGLNLILRPHSQLAQALQQRPGIAIEIDTQQGHVKGDPHHGDALVAALAVGQSIQQTAVVKAIA